MKLGGQLIQEGGYESMLSLRKTQEAIKLVKDFFQAGLARQLSLSRVSAPLFVEAGTGVNDDLSGRERPVSFSVRAERGISAEIVHSLAKWKRMALADYGFEPGEGIYADMNAIRPDEALDSTHSLYVDQWDWERVITEDERSLDFLKSIVRQIYTVLLGTETLVHAKYPSIDQILPEKISFVHAEELAELYPDLTTAEREDAAAEKAGAVFVIGIGHSIKGGAPHDARAPDYDDWSSQTSEDTRGLNGDIILWHPTLGKALEISSMGIRVDTEALLRQLEIHGCTERTSLLFHKRLLSGELPLSVGGGIGQSRLCMFFLRKAHIGEVQSSIWPSYMRRVCRESGIQLL